MRIKPKRRLPRAAPEELTVPRRINATWSMDSSNGEASLMRSAVTMALSTLFTFVGLMGLVAAAKIPG